MRVNLIGLVVLLVGFSGGIDGIKVHIVDQINELNTGFKAHHYQEFFGLTPSELLHFAGAPITHHHLKDNQRPVNYFDDLNKKKSKEDKFDVREKWPECREVFEDIQIQGNCSSSWAIATTTSIRDRRCILYNKTESLSSWDVVTCSTDGNGCLGSDHDTAFQFYLNKGVVSGDGFVSHKGCKPYPLKPGLKTPPNDTQCHKECQLSYNKNYNDDRLFGSSQKTFQYANKDLMEEIKTNGPVVAEFQLYEDLFYYSHGVYQHHLGNLIGYHYVKVVGWGMTKDGTKYWTAANTWGKNWGEDGFFRILRDNDECNFEANLIAGNVRDGGRGIVKTTTKQGVNTTVKTTAKQGIDTTAKTTTTQSQRPIETTVKTTTNGNELFDTTTTQTQNPIQTTTKQQSIETTLKTTTPSQPPQSTTLPSSSLQCQNIIGYFEGTFQTVVDRRFTFDGKFQLKANASLSDQKVYYGVDHWESDKIIQFGMFYWDLEIDEHCNSEMCSYPFPDCSTKNMFHVRHTKGYYWIDILDFPNFKNTFVLENVVGKCTKSQPLHLPDYTWKGDESLYSYCVCCGEYDPDPILNCPKNPWSNKPTQKPIATIQTTTLKVPDPTTTQKEETTYQSTIIKSDNPTTSLSTTAEPIEPIVTQKQTDAPTTTVKITEPITTTKKQSPTTTRSLVPQTQTCQKIIGYYNGTFQYPPNRSYSFDAQFQFKARVDPYYERIYFGIDHWDRKKTSDLMIGNWYYYQSNDEHCDAGQTCSIRFPDYPQYNMFHVNGGFSTDILDFEKFENAFKLENTIGKCTNNQPLHFPTSWDIDQSLYQYCVCCDEYDPDPVLNCPINPWQEKPTQRPTTQSSSNAKTTEPIVTTKEPIKTTKEPLIPKDQTCQKIVGYYEGKFQNIKDSSSQFNAQFQFKIDANLRDRKIYYGIDHWNKSYSNNDLLYFAFDSFSPNEINNCYTPGQNCTAPFVNQATHKIVDFKTNNVKKWFGLLDFPSFYNKFTLKNATKGCLNYQAYEDKYWVYTPDPSLFSYCLCCDEYNPDPSLNCPLNPWQQIVHKPTTPSKPIVKTTRPPKPTKAPSIPIDQTCQKIIGYYEGKLQDISSPSDSFNAQFQFKIDANLKDQKIYYGIQHWNQTKLKQGSEMYIAFDTANPRTYYNCYTPGQDCSIPFTDHPIYKNINVEASEVQKWLGILEFPSFNNSFTLKNSIGGCTNNQPYIGKVGYTPDPSLYSYCICCGEYNPDPSFNCPLNPWQEN